MNKRVRSAKSIEQSRQAPVTHGAHQLENRGPAALEPEKVSRLAELRQLVKTHPGRAELREELAARFALLVELGFSHLSNKVNRGENIWESGIIKRLATYAAEARRLLADLDNFASEADALDITESLGGEDEENQLSE